MQIKLKAAKDFSWARGGCVVERFAAEQIIDTDDADLARVSVSEGWAEVVGDRASKPARSKAHQAAPENKSA